jgi:tetratricopeptide (TPR) repeat protein
VYCSNLGKDEEAIKYAEIAVKASEYLIYSDNPYGHFNALNNLASSYGALGYSAKEFEIREFLVRTAKRIDPSVLEFPGNPFLSNLARCYSARGEYDKAIEIGLKVKELREKWGYKEFIANTDMMLSRTYRRNLQIEEALHHANQANGILKDIAGDDNLSLAESYDLLAIIYNDMGALDDAEEMEKEALKLKYNNIVNNSSVFE